MYDSSTGNGSVMDTRGRCLLVLHSHTTAKVLDVKGNTVAEYSKGDCSGCGSNGGEVFDTQQQSQGHNWDIEGLKMQFIPHNWEVLRMYK